MTAAGGRSALNVNVRWTEGGPCVNNVTQTSSPRSEPLPKLYFSTFPDTPVHTATAATLLSPGFCQDARQRREAHLNLFGEATKHKVQKTDGEVDGKDM